jgi:carboxypeptidase family protein
MRLGPPGRTPAHVNVRFLIQCALACSAAAAAHAQVVRGTITERATTLPIPGVVVSLVPDAGTGAISVLSNERGEYAIRATGPGQYRLDAKRIGAQRFVSEPFSLGAGETKRMDVALEAVVRLPEVRVVDFGLCVSDESQRQRVNSLWDEASTVLTAAQISLRDRLFEGHLTRYVRGLQPRTLRVLEESWGERKGVMERPFVAVSADSLSRVGYRRTIGEYEYYYAPDADVLLSTSFRREHCYDVVDGGRARRGMIGIAFEPAPSRKLPDVRGTIWLDARSFELRLVEFKYTLLAPFIGSDRVGGEVHFGKLSNGAWVTSRWFLRFPQFARPVSPVDAYSSIPSVIIRPTMYRLVEEGGMVFTEGLKLYLRPASVAGVVLDSAGRPFPGATVRLGGTPYATQSGTGGMFRLDSLPAGRFTLIVEHPSYAQAGSYVADEPVELAEGATANLTFRAAKTEELVEKACSGKLPKKDNGTLRILVVDRVTSRPLPSLRVWLRWQGRYTGSMENPETLRPMVKGGLESLTDASGAVTFCDLPADIRLVFSAVRSDGKPASDSTDLSVARNELKVSTVITRRPP